RPTYMIHYWKYLLALNFDESLARKNIVSALELMAVDPTIPPWSIYRVIVSRSMASQLLTEAKGIFSKINRSGPRTEYMGGLRNDLKAKLDDAFVFAMDSFNVHKTEHPKRGDILFGFEKDDAVSDGSLILEITLVYREIFGQFIATQRAAPTDLI